MIKTLIELKQFEDKCLFSPAAPQVPPPPPLPQVPPPPPLPQGPPPTAPRPAAAPYRPRPAEPDDPIVTVTMPPLADQNKALIDLIESTMNSKNSSLFKDEHQKYFNSYVELANLTFVEFKKIKPNDTNDPSYYKIS